MQNTYFRRSQCLSNRVILALSFAVRASILLLSRTVAICEGKEHYAVHLTARAWLRFATNHMNPLGQVSASRGRLQEEHPTHLWRLLGAGAKRGKGLRKGKGFVNRTQSRRASGASSVLMREACGLCALHDNRRLLNDQFLCGSPRS